MKENVIDARWIGQAFDGDPEIHLPRCPRLPPEILVVPFGTDALMLVGAKDKQILKGRTARTLLPRVLAKLDGDHTLEQLVANFPDESTHAVRDIVTLLYSRGLLEDGRAEPPPPQLRHVDSFLGRYVDVTRMNVNRGAARRRLDRAKVVVGGAAAAVAELAEVLTASGIGAVTVAGGAADLTGATLVLGVSASPDGEGTALLDAAHRAGVLSLGVFIGSDEVVLGPLGLPAQSSCYGCLRERGLPDGTPAPEVASFWTSMVALRAVHLLSGISNPPSFESFQRVRLLASGAVTELHHLPRTPGCAGCGLPGPPLAPGDPAYEAWSVYAATSKPPAEFLGMKDYQAHYNPKNIALAQEEARACAGAKVVPLPPPAQLDGSPWRAVPPLTPTVRAVDLATVLARAAGLHEVPGVGRRRVAPTGGNLGSVELGVVVTGVEGIEPGVYRYHAPRHVLERFPAASTRHIELALGTRNPLPAAVIVGLSGLIKVHEKYGTFAYRVVHFDAGVGATYVHRLAAALGLGVREYADFHDDALAELFLLDFEHAIQLPTFAIGLGEPAAPATSDPSALQRVIAAAGTSKRPVARAVTPAGLRGPAIEGATAPAASFEEILLRRRSVRAYTAAPIPGTTLRELARLGLEATRRRIVAGAAEATAIHFVLAVADGGSDLPAGIYHVQPDQPEVLVPGRRGLTAEQLRSCLLQVAHANAPAVFFAMGDMGHALADRGARGFRELMVQAGAAVGEVWLAATGYGLGACASGGVVEVGVQALAGADGYRSAPLLALSLGYPLAEPAAGSNAEREGR